MTEQVQVFENQEFGLLEVLSVEGKSFFPATECAAALGYKNPHDAIAKHCRYLAKREVPHPQSPAKRISRNFIPEGDLYRLIIRSKLPAADRFERWVFDEVLPTIRKHGAYVTEELLEKLEESQGYALELIGKLDAERRKSATLCRATAELAPKAAYCEEILGCGNAIPVSLIAKEYGMSAAAFNRLLCGLGIQYRVAGTWLPYQKYAGKGYTKTRTVRIGERVAAIYTCWTQAGRLFLYERLRECGIEPLTAVDLRTAQ